jgi:hypothetical protein
MGRTHTAPVQAELVEAPFFFLNSVIAGRSETPEVLLAPRGLATYRRAASARHEPDAVGE